MNLSDVCQLPKTPSEQTDAPSITFIQGGADGRGLSYVDLD